ncbi:NDK5 kinase, partial [Nyctibius grandis]|nr:NDK5 kinase [Nyctibius grandis]
MEMLIPEPQIFVERTLALIKPDVVDKEEEIEDVILQSGFLIIQVTDCVPEEITSLYKARGGRWGAPCPRACRRHRPRCSSRSSGPAGRPRPWQPALGTERGAAALLDCRDLEGICSCLPSSSFSCFSLRAIYGTDDLRNAVHGSLSTSSAEREIRFMFPEVILEPIPVGQRARDYLNLYVKPTLLAGLTALCKEKPADPMTWLADWLIEHNPNKPRVQYQITEEEHQ